MKSFDWLTLIGRNDENEDMLQYKFSSIRAVMIIIACITKMGNLVSREMNI